MLPLERADSQRLTVAMEPLFADELDDDDHDDDDFAHALTDAIPLPFDDFDLDLAEPPRPKLPPIPWQLAMPVAAPYAAAVTPTPRITAPQPPPIPARARRGTPPAVRVTRAPTLPTVIVRPSLATTSATLALAETSPMPAHDPDRVETTELPAKDLDHVETTELPAKPAAPVVVAKAPVLPDAPIEPVRLLAVVLSALACGLVATLVVVFA